MKIDSETSNKEERVRHVIETAKAHFIRYGYSGTTTMQIAQEAGISETTLFRYFANKRDLFQVVVQPLMHFEWFPEEAFPSANLRHFSILELPNELVELVAFAKVERRLVRMAIIESRLQPDLGGEYNPLENASRQLKNHLRGYGMDEVSSQTVIHLIMSLILTIVFTPYYEEETINLTLKLVEEQITKIITGCHTDLGVCVS